MSVMDPSTSVLAALVAARRPVDARERDSIARFSELIVELDNKRTEIVRRAWPFLRDRRIDDYRGLSARFLD